jgi:hypothetical protein
VGHAGTAARAARAVAGQPHDLAQEGLASEDAITEDFRLVHVSVVEMQPHRTVGCEAVADHDHALLQPRDVRSDRCPAVFVGHRPLGALAAVAPARAERRAHSEGWIKIRQLRRAWSNMAAELDRVATNEQMLQGDDLARDAPALRACRVDRVAEAVGIASSG